MSDRTLIPGLPLAEGELVQTCAGRPAIVRSISPGGMEATVELPGGALAAFRSSRLSRPFGDPARLVFLTAPDTPKPIEAALLESLRADGFTVRAEDGKVIAEHPTCQLDAYRAQCIEDNNAMMLEALEASPSV